MIALVRGTVAVRRSDAVVVDCGGVGYRLAVSAQTLKRVPAVGEPVTLHSHLVVRDDALTLFGFAAEAERERFRLLLGVQGARRRAPRRRSPCRAATPRGCWPATAWSASGSRCRRPPRCSSRRPPTPTRPRT